MWSLTVDVVKVLMEAQLLAASLLRLRWRGSGEELPFKGTADCCKCNDKACLLGHSVAIRGQPGALASETIVQCFTVTGIFREIPQYRETLEEIVKSGRLTRSQDRPGPLTPTDVNSH